MKLLILLSWVYLAHSGIISDETINHGIEHHERATSYQNIHIEHFHPVPTFIKKEHSHLLEHPIALGTSSSKLEVHHGGKHDHGYALTSAENNAHGHVFDDYSGSLGSAGGHEVASYQVQDQGNEYSQYQGQLGHEGVRLGHYALAGGEGYGEYQETGNIQQYDHQTS